jgi:hypothetical protein
VHDRLSGAGRWLAPKGEMHADFAEPGNLLFSLRLPVLRGFARHEYSSVGGTNRSKPNSRHAESEMAVSPERQGRRRTRRRASRDAEGRRRARAASRDRPTADGFVIPSGGRRPGRPPPAGR